MLQARPGERILDRARALTMNGCPGGAGGVRALTVPGPSGRRWGWGQGGRLPRIIGPEPAGLGALDALDEQLLDQLVGS
jgi:hypothetical protein